MNLTKDDQKQKEKYLQKKQAKQESQEIQDVEEKQEITLKDLNVLDNAVDTLERAFKPFDDQDQDMTNEIMERLNYFRDSYISMYQNRKAKNDKTLPKDNLLYKEIRNRAEALKRYGDDYQMNYIDDVEEVEDFLQLNWGGLLTGIVNDATDAEDLDILLDLFERLNKFEKCVHVLPLYQSQEQHISRLYLKALIKDVRTMIDVIERFEND